MTIILLAFVVLFMGTAQAQARPAAPPDGTVEKPEKVEAVEPTPAEFTQISSLVEQLGAGRLAQRERAMVELAAFEGRALGQIREAKNHDDDEIAMRAAQLEKVIEQSQGPLFLAARRLNLNISDLNTRLQADDLEPLLNLLKSNAEAGMVPLWALIFRRLARRDQIYTAAEICRDVEGRTGYGQALARAASDKKLQSQPMSLISLSFLMPPDTAMDCVDMIASLWTKVGQTGGADNAFRSASSLRGFFDTAEIFAALPVRRVPHDADTEFYSDVRAAIAFTMIANCDSDTCRDSRIPSVTSMSPLVLDTWLNMLARSGLTAEIENCLLQLIGAGADNARVKSAAGAWASVADQNDVIELFPSLSISSCMAVVDSWWVQPRDAVVTQKFAADLAASEFAWQRECGIRLLSQLQCNSTITALLASASKFADTAHYAFSALENMAEAMTKDQLLALQNMHGIADALARPAIVETLFRSGDVESHKFLKSNWKAWLPRNELVPAILVYSDDASTPIGAVAAAFLPRFSFDEDEELTSLTQTVDSHDLTLLRSLIGMSTKDGFALLTVLASDERETWRNIYALALALAGKDGEHISGWIKRLTGETPDEDPSDFEAAISASLTTEAEEFRKNIQEEGVGSQHYQILFWSVMNGRCKSVTQQEVRTKVFKSTERMGYYGRLLIRMTGEVTEKESLAYATHALSSGASTFLSSWYMHVIRQSGADALKAMFGTSGNPVPRDNDQIIATAMLGEKERARKIISSIKTDNAGSNFQTLMIARAWLDLFESPKDAQRIRRVYGFSANYTFGQIHRLALAENGDVTALRELMDASHPNNRAFASRGVVAYISFQEGRWGDVETKMSRTLSTAMNTRVPAEPISFSLLAPKFKSAPDRNWQRWWQSNRGRIFWNATADQFELKEMP
ncbi:MAG: hypothetical protein ACYTDT_01690 [Planctomycetota bacterium]